MKLYVTLTKRSLSLVLAVTVILVLISLRLFSVGKSAPNGETEEARMLYIEELGLTADDSASTAEKIIIPESFSELYREYNAIQKQAGFDLSDYKGKEVTLYTYPFGADGKKMLHLLVFNGRIIGGDIASLEADSELKPLLPL